MKKNKALIVLSVALFYFGSMYICAKVTSYFYVDAGYNSVLAEQIHFEVVATHLVNNDIRLAEEYIKSRIEANDTFLDVAIKSDTSVSEQTRVRILDRLGE